MPGRNYYILSSLPGLGELGSSPPMTKNDFINLLEGNKTPKEVALALFLSDDLLIRDSFLAGDKKKIESTVLTNVQIAGEAPLPNYLLVHEPQTTKIHKLADKVWRNYFFFCDNTARSSSNRFLMKWTRNEVALRNSISIVRARILGLEPDGYLVARELGNDAVDFDKVIADWSNAGDPLSGLKILDDFRWQWIKENDNWFTFSDDELAAYAAKLLLLHRWQRISRQQSENTDTEKDSLKKT